jgi:hypothetical protein
MMEKVVINHIFRFPVHIQICKDDSSVLPETRARMLSRDPIGLAICIFVTKAHVYWPLNDGVPL